MVTLQMDDHIFSVDAEKTRDYYLKHSCCDCPACRNYYAAVKSRLKKLDAFLCEFGVDITRPDELGWGDADDLMNYLFAAYTVCGAMVSSGKYQLDINDGLPLHLEIEKGCVPGEEKSQNYFVISVFNIRLPWVIDESLPTAEKKKNLIKPGDFSGNRAHLPNAETEFAQSSA